MAAMKKKVSKCPRGQNWTEEERLILTNNVLEREHILFGKFKGDRGEDTITADEKMRAWNEVFEAVNANAKETRSLEQIRKQYDNIKQRAKSHVDGLKRPKTGGGPAPSKPTPAQMLYINRHEEAPHMVGLEDVYDTEDAVIPSTSGCAIEPSESASEQVEVVPSSQLITEETDVTVMPIEKSTRPKTSSKKRRREDLEEDVLKLELKKSELELDILNLKKKAAEKEIDAYEAVYNAGLSVQKYFDMKVAEFSPFESD